MTITETIMAAAMQRYQAATLPALSVVPLSLRDPEAQHYILLELLAYLDERAAEHPTPSAERSLEWRALGGYHREAQCLDETGKVRGTIRRNHVTSAWEVNMPGLRSEYDTEGHARRAVEMIVGRQSEPQEAVRKRLGQAAHDAYYAHESDEDWEDCGETCYRIGYREGAASAEAALATARVGLQIAEAHAATDRREQAEARVAAWQQTAEQYARNVDYYRGLVVRIGAALGSAAYTADDGSKQQDVLCAKVPELVDDLRAQLAALTTERKAMLAAGECPRKQG